MKLGILGPKGTFSDIAALKFEEKTNTVYEKIYYPTINQIFDDYKNLDLIIVPIENTLDGHITQTLDEMLDKNLKIIDQIMVDVSFSLLSNANSIEEIDLLNVQFKAKGQCVKFINSLRCNINITESNMESFELLSKGGNVASIVPNHKFDNNYKIAIKDVCDSKNNQTKFVVLRKNDLSFGNKCYLCMKMIYEDRSGLLCDILSILNEYDFNLSFILSRPTKTEFGKYNFFAEISNITNHNKLYEAFAKIEQLHLAKVEILGLY